MTSCVALELGWLFRGPLHGGWGLGLCSSLSELWLQAPPGGHITWQWRAFLGRGGAGVWPPPTASARGKRPNEDS